VTSKITLVLFFLTENSPYMVGYPPEGYADGNAEQHEPKHPDAKKWRDILLFFRWLSHDPIARSAKTSFDCGENLHAPSLMMSTKKTRSE
jgi:hypothetical protein